MEAKTVSKKRKQPSAFSAKYHPLTAVFTRSKYQALLHRSRSGRTRPDPTFAKRPQLSQLHFPEWPRFQTRTSIKYDQEPSIDDDLLCNLIKDLRSRRVFSPDSKVRCEFDCDGLNDEETVVKNGGSERLNNGFSLIGGNLDETEASKSDKIEKVELGIPCADQNLNDVNPGMEFNVGIVESANRNWVGHSADEAEQTTQPTAAERLESSADVLVSSDNYPNDECVRGGFNKNDDEKTACDSKTKLVLRPCFRRKVFKTPGSVSYRRLLPYLMEITESKSGPHENSPQQKLDRGLGELPAVLASQSEEGEASVGRLNDGNIVPEKCHASTETKEAGGFTSNVKDGGIANLTSSCIFKEVHMGEHHESGGYLEDTKFSARGGTESIDTWYPCKVEKPNDTKESEDYAGVLNEESMQMTPPDEIIARLGVVENEVSLENMFHNEDHGVVKQTNSINNINNNVDDKGCDSSPKSKLGLNHRSRLKLFRNPGSFSYRRLLPFLLDIMKDNSCSLTGHYPKPKKDPEEESLSPSLASDIRELPLDESHVSALHTNCVAHPASTRTTTSELSDDNEPSPISPEHSAESEIAIDSQNEDLLQVEDAVSDKPCKLESSPANFGSVQGANPLSLRTINFEASSKAENVTPLSRQSTVVIDSTASWLNIEFSNGTKFTEADSISQRPSHLDVPVVSGVLAVSARKGILKRNPRGCRGLCNCLNCASFRLHAEKAFEFSKNQMQDAEEVALDLIKELSYLRNTLEKSADGSDNQNLVDANKVEEICKKAYETEELAKCRLSQMNYDLNIHCRITTLQRPRVRFANYVEEKVILKDNFPGKL